MPPFGHRKPAAPPAPPELSKSDHVQPAAELSATERWNALQVEQSAINATLDAHREQRIALLREDGELDLDAIRAIQTEDSGLKLRLEQLALRLPDIERELNQERQAQFEAAWQNTRPALAAAEAELTEAVRTFLAALAHANAVYFRAENFGERLREFVRPPPGVIFNEWALREYVKTVDRRQSPNTASVPMLQMLVDAPLNIPPERRFQPRRVPVAEIEAISAIAEPRWVKVLYGPVKTANLQIGIARMFAGEQHKVSARAAHALVASGIAEYVEENVPAIA